MQLTTLTPPAFALLFLSAQASAQQESAPCGPNRSCDSSLVCVQPYEDGPGTCRSACSITSDQPCPLGNRCVKLPGFTTLEAGYCPEPVACGTFLGITCTDEFNPACVDDPRDDCEPSKGDADCSGICVINANVGTRAIEAEVGLSCDGINGHSSCPAGSQCVKNPKFLCDPTTTVCQARCAPERSCDSRGLAPCFEGETCVHDPNSTCAGAADCPGVCRETYVKV